MTASLSLRQYGKANKEKQQINQLKRATDYFDQAGSQLDGTEQIHAYCLAGLCSFLCQDEVARKHYFGLALQSLHILQGNKLDVSDYMRVTLKWTITDMQKSLKRWLTFKKEEFSFNSLFGIDAYREAIQKQKEISSVYSEDDILPGFGCTVKALNMALLNASQA